MTRQEFDEAYDNGYKHGYAAGRSDSDVLDKIRAEIEHTGAYEQEVYGKTEFLKGIDYCLGVIAKYKAESEEVYESI